MAKSKSSKSGIAVYIAWAVAVAVVAWLAVFFIRKTAAAKKIAAVRYGSAEEKPESICKLGDPKKWTCGRGFWANLFKTQIIGCGGKNRYYCCDTGFWGAAVPGIDYPKECAKFNEANAEKRRQAS